MALTLNYTPRLAWQLAWARFFVCAILGCVLVGRLAHAQVQDNGLSVSMIITDQFRTLTHADRQMGKTFYFYTSAQPDAAAPVAALSADVYVGFIRADGMILSWARDSIGATESLLPSPGLRPLVSGLQLAGGFDNSSLLGNNRFLTYMFVQSDPPGIYQWFTLLVRAGQSPEDTSQWITIRTRMLPVK
jgi:hypothetical protein